MLFLNNGRGLETGGLAVPQPPNLPEFGGQQPLTVMGAQLGLAIPIDYDGDGAEDVLLPYPDMPVVPNNPSTGRLTRWLLLKSNRQHFDVATAAQYVPEPYWPARSFYDELDYLSARGPRAVDHNGDGHLDIVGLNEADDKFEARTSLFNDTDSNARADVVVAFDNGSAAPAPDAPVELKQPTVEVNYARLLVGPPYEFDRDACAHPCERYAGPRLVVRRHAFPNLTGAGEDNVTSRGRVDVFHNYVGARLDRARRDWLGFRSRSTQEYQTGHDGIPRYGVQTQTVYDNVTLEPAADAFIYAGQPRLRMTASRDTCPGGGGPMCFWLAVDDVSPSKWPSRHGASYFVAPSFRVRFEYERMQSDRALDQLLTRAMSVADVFAPSAAPAPLSAAIITEAYDSFGNQTYRSTTTNASPFEGPSTIYKTDLERTYDINEATWLVALPKLTKVTDSTPRGTSTRTGETTCDPTTGLPTQVTIATPGEPDHWLDTTFERDDYGNAWRVTTTDAQGRRRQRAYTYEPDGVFLHAIRNALGHTAYVKHEPLMGAAVEAIDVKGQRTSATYDRLGELRGQQNADGTSVSRLVARELVGVESFLAEQVTSSDGGSAATRFDRLGRPFHGRSVTLEGQVHETRRAFAVDGTVREEYLPTFVGTAPPGKTSYTYDTKGRLTGVTFPDDTTQRYLHIGFNRVFFDELGRESFTTQDMRGQVVQSVDATGVLTNFYYGPFGTLVRAANSKGVVTTTTYDAYGRALESNDPDRGNRTMRYDAFEQLVFQRDALGREYYFEYDALGRPTRTRQARGDGAFVDQETNFGYDAGGPGAIGETASVSTFRNDGANAWHNIAYRYDALGRVTRVDNTLPSVGDPAAPERLRFEYSYDGQGRLSRVNYPAVTGAPAFGVNYTYSASGFLRSAAEVGAAKAFWTALLVDPAGRVREHHFGNDAVTTRTFQPLTGRLDTVETKGPTPAGGTAPKLQSLRYDYYANGNLWHRVDNLQGTAGRSEEFTYDSRDRLKTGKLVGQTTDRYSYTYDDLGNIETQLGVGAYVYDTARPHILKSVAGQAYEHDAVGNQTLRPGGIAIAYDALDKPVRMTQNGAEVATFLYDGLGTRARKKTATKTTTYVGELFERTQHADGRVEHVLRVVAGGASVAEVVFSASSATATPTRAVRYLHPDNLGSPDTITGPTAAVAEKRSYAPFGQRRSPDWANTGAAASPTTTSSGFTGHEEDDELGLVYMKGRTYDPKLGRFLQADPFVSIPAYSQSWNPYAYVLNNPLAFVDPSGYEPDLNGCREHPEAPGCTSGGLPPGSHRGASGEIVADDDYDPNFWVDEVIVTPGGSSRREGSHSPPTLFDSMWSWERGSGSSEAGRDRAGGRDGTGRMRPFNPNDVGYRLAVGVTQNIDRKLNELPDDFLTAVDVISIATGAGGVAKVVGGAVLKGLGKGLGRNVGTAMVETVAAACPGGKCGVCFEAGTEVWTADGLVPIEQVAVGQLVLSRDEATGELGWKRVVRTFVTADKATLALSLRDDERGEHEQVDATAEHPFWLEGRGWVGAGELEPGQRVLRADGRWLRVERVEAKAGRTTVYNLEVDDWHTYVVGELGAWVHNTCPPKDAAKAAVSATEKLVRAATKAGAPSLSKVESAGLRTLFGRSKDGVQSLLGRLRAGEQVSLPEGVTKETLQTYRVVAQRAIEQGRDTLGVQAARQEAIDLLLK